MSRGPGKLQTEILRALKGEGMQVFRASRGGLETGELLEELRARGAIEDHQSRKVAMFAIRRACDGLVRRELIQGLYVPSMDNPGRTTIQWSPCADCALPSG